MSDILSLLWLPFLECLVLIGMHCYLGMHIVNRGVIFVDLSLAQIAALGTAFALLLGLEASGFYAHLVTLGFCIAGAAIFAFTRMKDERIPQEAIIGIVYAVSAALAILVLDHAPEGAEHVKELTFGSILTTTKADILKTTLLYTGIGIFHFIFRKQFIMISFNPEQAKKEGISIKLWDFLFYVSFGFLVTQSVGIAGVLLVFSFLIVPAVCAILFTTHIWTRLILGWGLGFIASVIGMVLSVRYDLPTAATIVSSFGLVLLLSVIVRMFIGKQSKTTY